VSDTATDVTPTFDLTGDLGWLLGQVVRRYVAATKVAFADVPGGARGYHVLAAASVGCYHTQLELGRSLGVDRTVMVHLVDSLERDGLLERRPDPDDRRARILVITDAGARSLTAVSGRLRAAEEVALAPLDPTDRQPFLGAMRALASAADLPSEAEDCSGDELQEC
jgi:DNA-binding MarR family transcriptional regulator